MGTGIVSVALEHDGHEALSRIVLALAAALWLLLAAAVIGRAVGDRAGLLGDARTPAALTGSAATAVLGTRLTLLGWTWAGIAALCIAALLWAALLEPVLGALERPAVGVELLVAVAPEALAVLAATVAEAERAAWLLVVALAPFALGLLCYAYVIARFDARQLAVGRGDHWIAGGAVAIAALAAGLLTSGTATLGVWPGAHAPLRDVALVLWATAMLWLVALLVAEARWPRPAYDPHRWSTVFPLGMYAVCSFAVGAAAHAGGVTDFARVWVWVAFAVWAVVLVGTVRHARQDR